jgi:ribosome-associated toxin RatA of RatAB toxin-antitoxin module
VKELHGQASGEVRASAEQCFALLADVEGYPSWYPQVVRRAEALESGRARVTLHVAQGPLVRDFDLLFDVHTSRPERVELARVPHDRSDPERFEVSWLIEPSAAGARLQLRLYGKLSLPRLLPIGGAAEGIVSGFLAAATKALSGAQA